MSDDLELDKDTQHYFDTGGEVTGDLAKEAATPPESPPAPSAEAPAAAPPVAEDKGTTPPAADDDDDDTEEAAAPQPGQQQPERQRRRFSRKEFESERQARLEAERQLNEDRVKAARVEERLSLLQQALTEPQEPAKAPARPDPEQDIFGYTRWLEEQLNTVTSKINTYEEQISTGQQEMDNERRYFEALNAYAGTKQDFVQAYNYLLRSRAAELTAQSYAVTPEQLQGIMDGKVRVPTQIADALRQEERSLYRTAFDRGADPAATIYNYATMRGYRTPAVTPPAAPAPAAGVPGTPLGGQPATSAKPALPTATDVVAQIQRGQQASASLSKAGGTAPDTELTPEVLANMSEDDFERLYDELSNSKNKDKLKQIFGH